MADLLTDAVKKYFTIGNTILLVGILVSQVRWQTQVDNRLQVLETHANDKVVHMPLDEKINLFVPRVEIYGQLNDIKASLQEIKADLKKNFEK
jgi:hypothetical protein